MSALDDSFALITTICVDMQVARGYLMKKI